MTGAEFGVLVTGFITFKVMLTEGVLKAWSEVRTHKSRKSKQEKTPMPEYITVGIRTELTITVHKPENMEAAFSVTGERRKTLVEAIKSFVDAPAIYQNAPSFAYVIGDYTVNKTGTVSGPANDALMAALNAKGFIIE